jgi:hypothetical protein
MELKKNHIDEDTKNLGDGIQGQGCLGSAQLD